MDVFFCYPLLLCFTRLTTAWLQLSFQNVECLLIGLKDAYSCVFSVLCVGRLGGIQLMGRYRNTEEAETILSRRSRRSSKTCQISNWGGWLQEQKQVQRTTRAMWEESEGVLLFARTKPKHFLYWHTLNVPQPSSRAFPQGEPLLWTPAPLASAGSPTSVPGAVWASHKSGFCPHRTQRLHLNKKNEILLSHSSVWWLSCLLLNCCKSLDCLFPSKFLLLAKTLSSASTKSFSVTTSL